MSGALDRHGTRAFVLKPSAVVAAVEADLVLRERKRKRRGQHPAGGTYVFHRDHVRRASCALDLVDRAIRDRYAGVGSGKRITRLVYGDEELLAATRALLSPIADGAAP